MKKLFHASIFGLDTFIQTEYRVIKIEIHVMNFFHSAIVLSDYLQNIILIFTNFSQSICCFSFSPFVCKDINSKDDQ